MARRARITVTLVEHNDEITIHLEDERFPPLWFTKRDRPLAHAKLKGVLDELEVVEEIPVIGPTEFRAQGWSGWDARSA